jgi:hypothetical protein
MTTLQDLINDKKQSAFRFPDTASDEEALGLLIAKHYRWDGGRILSALQYALEDANFHDLNSKISDLAQKEFA